MRSTRGDAIRLVLPISILLAGCAVAPAFSQELPFAHYTVEKEVNPLPSSAVMMTHQDRSGYIWFVVYSSGLVRYDGRKQILYDLDDGLPSVDVRELIEDPSGRLWVATEAGLAVTTKGVGEYGIGESIVFTDSIGSVPLISSSIIENRVCVDEGGVVWTGTRNLGIIRYIIDGHNGLFTDTLSTALGGSEENLDVRSLAARADGTIWASLSGGRFMAYRPDGTRIGFLVTSAPLPAIDCDALHETPSGTLYGGYVDGSVLILPGSIGSRVQPRVIETRLSSRITDITSSGDGEIWISSEQSGLVRMTETGKRVTRYDIRNGLLSDLVRHVLVDAERNIWISQIGGVSKLRADYLAYTSFTSSSYGGQPPYLRNDGVNNVIPPGGANPFGGTWVATSGGGVSLVTESGPTTHIGTADGLKSDWIHGLVFDSSGRLWIGTSSGISCLTPAGGVSSPAGQSRRRVLLPHGPAVLTGFGFGNSTIYSCEVFPLQAERGTAESVWFTGYRAIFSFVRDRWFVFQGDAGLPETYFTSIVADSEGIFWVGTRDEGLYRSRGPVTFDRLAGSNTRVFQRGPGGEAFGEEMIDSLFEPVWSTGNGAPSNQIESLVLGDGVLWIGTPEGLTALNVSSLTTAAHLGPEDGLPGADVTSMAVRNVDNHLWLGTNGGLAEVDPVKRKVIRSVTKEDGLLDNEVWWYGSVRVGEDGRVYFGTASGLALFDPSKAANNSVEPRVHIREVQFRENLAGNSLVIRYAGLSFADERQVRFRTILEGFEEEWSTETDEVTMRYTNLPAFFFSKTYTARIQAKNNHGYWSETPASYAVTVQPPWWLQWWFSLFNVLVLLTLGYVFLHYRTVQLKRRSEVLEQTVAERTVEIRQKAEQISLQKDELEEKNAEILRTQEQLIVQEKLASLGSLTAGIAHEIKNPLNFVNNFSDVSVEIAQELKEDLESIRELVDPEVYKRLEFSCLDLQENARKIHDHGTRADGIVKGMLEHSRGETGTKETIKLNSLVDEYVTLAYHGIKARDPDCTIVFRKQYDTTLPQIRVYPQDLSRVILNIVNNACYAVNKKKEREGRVFEPTVAVSTATSVEGIVIAIRDNGDGMSPEVVSKVFNPFFTTKPTGEGTGLGMSLSYDIVVKQHGGKLEVETESGAFTEFRIILPVQEQEA